MDNSIMIGKRNKISTHNKFINMEQATTIIISLLVFFFY